MIKTIKYLILFSMFFMFSIKVAALQAPVDITKMDVYDLQEAMDVGILNSELLVNLYLERIEQYDGLFNAINQINDEAIKEAKKLDQERAAGKVRSKLHGIPIVVKTNIDVKGMATTGGTKSLQDNFPLKDAYVVEKLREAGAIILASTNMSELAFSASNSYSSYGYVRNVFNVDYTPYGSSGGSAVAVAASFAAAALGTDTNSSVRVPASGAGLVGMRPTLGLVSRTGVIPYDIERDTVGILTKSVRDNSLILGIISGEDVNDSYTENVDSYDDSYLEIEELSNYTIGVVSDFVYGKANASLAINKLTEESIVSLLDKSISELSEAGAKIVYIDKFMTSYYYQIATSTYAGITLCDSFNQYIKGTTGSIRSFQKLASSTGHIQDLTGYVEGCNGQYESKKVRDEKKNEYREYVDKIFLEYGIDILLYPTLKNNIFAYNKTGIISPSSSLSSVIGYPAITVPMGQATDNFYYGVEFLSKAYEENKLYNVALFYENINNNKLINSSLTPALYEVSSNDLALVDFYLNSDLLKSNEILYSDAKKYFANYDGNDEQAEIILKKFDDYQKYLSKKRVKKVILFIVIATLILFFLTKKKKRKKRKKRNRG